MLDCIGVRPRFYWKPGNKAKFACILTKIKDFAVRLEACGKGGPSGSRALVIKGAHHMTDSTGNSQSLADLLEVGSTEAFDWDTSALADWPNIAPNGSTAPISSAELLAAGFDQAH